MEDYILKEIDKIGQMLTLIAKRLGLFESHTPEYTLSDVTREFNDGNLPFNLDTVLQLDNPVLYLVEKMKLSDAALESFIEIIFHSDLCEERKNASPPRWRRDLASGIPSPLAAGALATQNRVLTHPFFVSPFSLMQAELATVVGGYKKTG